LGLVLAYVTGFVATLALAVSNADAAGGELSVDGACLAGAFATLPLVGALIEWHDRGNGVGRLLFAIGLGMVLAVFAAEWATAALRADPGSRPAGRAAAWIAAWAVVPALGAGVWFLAVFPSGRIVTPWLRRVSPIALGSLGLLTVAQAFAPGPIPDGSDAGGRLPPIDNPLGVEALERPASVATALGVAGLIGFGLAGLVDLVRRYRWAHAELRRQLRCLALPAPLLPLSLAGGIALGDSTASDVVIFTGQVLFLIGTAAGIAVAVLRHRLYSIDLVVRRSLLFGALTALVVGGYAAVVGLTDLLVADHGDVLPPLAATTAVAIAFHPARMRVQRAVDRLVYGQRAEPYAALTALGEQLGAAIRPSDVPDSIVSAIARTIRTSRVELQILTSAGPRTFRDGDSTASGEVFPLRYQGRRLGALTIAPAPGAAFSDAERRLITDLARQVGPALDAYVLTEALRRSREAVVSGREEERLRMRRDLHDGLGPTLAGLALLAEAAADRAETDPDQARAILDDLQRRLASATDEIRDLVHGLRPPALDELGLVGALRATTSELNRGTNSLSVDLDTPERTPDLPAAVEVAVLRVAGEAVTNVVRHSRAHHCTVRLRVADQVELDVTDDGVGIAPGADAGLGLRSMDERARELGGTLDVATFPHGGTAVRLRIPITAGSR
jgi:signal transduction histidine kinase